MIYFNTSLSIWLRLKLSAFMARMDGEVTIAKKKERKARKGKKEQRRKYGEVRTAKKKGKNSEERTAR